VKDSKGRLTVAKVLPFSRAGSGAIRGRDLQRAFSPAAIVTLSNRIRPAVRRWGRVALGRHEMDVSLLIGAPLGLGILLALGILMVAMSYLSQ
jgi:hypothetical protein